MKPTGIVRKLDRMGRLALPMELRRTFEIEEKDALEIFVDGNMLLLKKYQPVCIFCGNSRNVQIYKDKNICQNCMNELKI